ncbi:MAG TPA: 3-deoxy-8-phosphooctulonate synthase, partial [Flavobacteriaceae bacterium]|nr:3-deoxy-8-phosphooctulonate synthase [Flavobacteriaceae bacterium]
GKVVNLKKGQFMSAESMQHAVQKVLDSGNDKVMLTDRGTMFGYQDMIVDFRGIPTMREFATTVLDVTHSLQQPNQSSGVTGGRPDMIETIARAGIVNNVDGLFIETHFDPANAKSDGANMLHLDHLEGLLSNLVEIRKVVNGL